MTSDNRTRFQLFFRALSSRNYLLFFIGQGISLIGTWLQFTAIGWLVYRLTNSAFLLGTVGFAGQFPSFLLASFAGVIADSFNRRKILMITQIMYMIQSFILAMFVLTGIVTIWHVVILSLITGCIGAFDMTTRQSFVVDIVDKKEHLGNAIALNSILFNSARLIGPSIAGLLIAYFGEGMCFLLDSISFLPIIIALVLIKSNQKRMETRETRILQGIKEGLTYILGSVSIKTTLFLTGLVSLMGMSYGVLMPVFAKDIFHGGPRTLGYLISASGLGAIVGAASMASKKSPGGLEKTIPSGSAIFGMGLIGFSFASNLYFAFLLLFLAGLGMMVFFTSANTLLQSTVEVGKIGRVMSYYTMAFMGTMPFGSLLSGILANKIGVQNTVFMGGVFCIAGALIFVHIVKPRHPAAYHDGIDTGNFKIVN